MSKSSNFYSANPLINYTLQLADSTLILSHRNSEWCGHGPILEQDIALTNIALDLLGQARSLYQYAAELLSKELDFEVTEDHLAYLRYPNEFKNLLLVEQENGHWGVTILRQFYFSVFQHYFYSQLKNSNNSTLASIANKSLKEVAYHLRWCSDWVIRLGDGTLESNKKMNEAIDILKDFVEELFQMSIDEKDLLQNNVSVDLSSIKPLWQQKVEDVFTESTLQFKLSTNPKNGGKQGNHSENLTRLLNTMQELQRAHPNCQW